MNGKAITAFAATLVAFSSSGIPRAAGGHPWTSVSAPSQRAAEKPQQSPEDEGSQLFRAGRYMEAAQRFRARHEEALARNESAKAVSSLNDLAGCYFATFQYRQAMRYYLESKRLAEATGGREHLPGLSANISSLYLQLGDVRAARHAAEEGLRSIRTGSAPHYRALLLFQLGQVYFRLGERTLGEKMYCQGIEEAAQRGNLDVQVRGWDHFGWELLMARDYPGAESALSEAFRLRRLQRSPNAALSYRKLGLLKLAQGDLTSAEVLLDQAVAASHRSAATIPPWIVYHARGELRMAQGRTGKAFEDFRAALVLARRWKLEVLPADAVRISAGVGLEQVSASFVRAGNRLYEERPDRALAEATLTAAEENRAWALRSLLATPSRMETALPGEYWETLTRLQRTEVASLATGSPAARRESERLRAVLTEMETRAGLGGTPGKPARTSAQPSMVARIQRTLTQDDALFVFHASESECWVWAVTRTDFDLYRISGLSTLSPLALKFRRAVLVGSPEARELGEQLCGVLFGRAPRAALGKRDWILVADDVLHHVPLAALVAGRSKSGPSYLIEKHSLRFAPAAALIEPGVAGAIQGGFLGVGDAVFNTADGRWRGSMPREPETGWYALLRRWPHFRAEARSQPATAAPTLELARLSSSLAEIRACAQAWGAAPHNTVLLTGTQASRASLERELGRRPAVVHLATHVLRSREWAGSVGLALSLNPEGQVELLGPELITAWRYPVDLVVLSGCSSGNYPASGDSARLVRATTYSLRADEVARTALPGEGIPGLSRAWLAAGARTVAASLWPTPDDTGQLFRVFYSNLRESSGAGIGVRTARALRQAQLNMLQSSSWRSQPRYWAAFFITGKE
jgi:CHAT domain-containing protein/tetratricopeptide (TPR) repeat protein